MNKSVFVTGATQGTGFAIAGRFAKEGYDVFITSMLNPTCSNHVGQKCGLSPYFSLPLNASSRHGK